MLQQRAPGLRRRHAAAAAHQQTGAERIFHVADARARSREREMRAFGAVRDAARLHHMAEQAQIGEVETHVSFAFREGWLYQIPIAGHETKIIISPLTKQAGSLSICANRIDTVDSARLSALRAKQASDTNLETSSPESDHGRRADPT